MTTTKPCYSSGESTALPLAASEPRASGSAPPLLYSYSTPPPEPYETAAGASVLRGCRAAQRWLQGALPTSREGASSSMPPCFAVVCLLVRTRRAYAYRYPWYVWPCGLHVARRLLILFRQHTFVGLVSRDSRPRRPRRAPTSEDRAPRAGGGGGGAAGAPSLISRGMQRYSNIFMKQNAHCRRTKCIHPYTIHTSPAATPPIARESATHY